MDNDDIICRLCLKVVPMGYTLIEENVLDTIKALTSIDISVNDNLPQLSCSKCIFNLYFVANVRKVIINSDEKLHSLFLRDGNFNELLKRVNTFELEESPEEQHDSVLEIKQENVDNVDIVSETLEEYQDNSDEDDDETSKEDKVNMNSGRSVSDDQIFLDSIISRKNDTKPYLYHCNVCNVDFQGHKLYNVHKGKHMKKTCDICGATTRQDNFYKHMTNHTLGQQICDICGSVHKSLEGLRTHLFHFHNAKKKPYICDKCGEKFKYSHRLSYHKRKVHTGFRPHQCETCGQRFFDLGTLKKHVKLVHLKLREYHCKYCQKNYTSSYALKVHTRQHTDETPYVCEYCTEGFRQLVSLKTHLARYHKEKPSTSQPDENEVKEEEEITLNDDMHAPGVKF